MKNRLCKTIIVYVLSNFLMKNKLGKNTPQPGGACLPAGKVQPAKRENATILYAVREKLDGVKLLNVVFGL